MLPEPSDDGLTTPLVGRWSKRKYHFLHRYLNLFSTGMKNKWPERHYIDLFAGAGIVRTRDTGELLYGSPMIAAGMTDPFSMIHVIERDPSKFVALDQRLRTSGARYTAIAGDANEHIHTVIRGLPSRGALCVAFADPYGLHLDFETVRALAQRHCDLIVLLADTMDALRNWATYYYDNPNSSLDRFMGESGWRETLQNATTDQQARAIRSHYEQRLKTLGYQHFASERVRNDHGSDIYTLLYASRHPTGLAFWHKAVSVDEGGQRSLF